LTETVALRIRPSEGVTERAVVVAGAGSSEPQPDSVTSSGKQKIAGKSAGLNVVFMRQFLGVRGSCHMQNGSRSTLRRVQEPHTAVNRG
jgi:hypothetical protein